MKTSKITIIRTIILFISLINVILEIFGVKTIPVDNEIIGQVVSALLLLYSTVSSWWHNNSFTKEAVQADEVLKQLKKGE